MKARTLLTHLSLAGLLLWTMACNKPFDAGLNSNETNNLDDAAIQSEATLSKELADAQDGGVQVEDVDAIFSLGWHQFYNPTADAIQTRSDAFAVAPSEDFAQRPPFHAGLDMGAVVLRYNDTALELLKVQMRNGGVFYNYGRKMPGNPRGMMHDQESASDDIPFIPGGAYSFEASGTENFAPVTVQITAPTELLQITGPEMDAVIDSTTDLEVTWQGGESTQPLVVALMPIFDRARYGDHNGQDGPGNNGMGPGRGGNGGPGRGGHGMGPGHGGQGMGPGQGGNHNGPGFGPGEHQGGPGFGPGGFTGEDYHYVIEDNTGSFTIPAETIAEIASLPGTKGLAIRVMQLITSEIDQDGAKYAVQIRTGDFVKVSFSQN